MNKLVELNCQDEEVNIYREPDNQGFKRERTRP